jgi:hypothetical protein
MPLQKQQRCGAADASSSSGGGISSSLKHHRRAKGVTADSISGGVSQKQQRAKVDEEMTPQKLRQGAEKAGTVSRGGGVVHRIRNPRVPSTTVKRTQAGDGAKNTKNKTSLNSDVSCRLGLLDIDNAAHAGGASLDHGPSMDAHSQSTTAQDCREAVAKQCAKGKAATSSIVSPAEAQCEEGGLEWKDAGKGEDE